MNPFRDRLEIANGTKTRYGICLASESPRRRAILRRLGVRFKKVSSRYREKALPGLSPRQLVLKHALEKANHAVVPIGARFVLAADTIVWCRGKVIGKPKTMAEARKTLFLLSGRRHFVYTGVVVQDRRVGRIWSGVAITKVFFEKVDAEWIRRYTSRVVPFDKAGAYAIQEGPKIVSKIVGSYTNVMGLPEELVMKLLKKAKAL